MDNFSKQKDRRILRERKQLRDPEEEISTKMGSESTGSQQINLNLAGSQLEFKKFQKLLGDSLERVQSLRKGGRTSRQPSQERKQQGEYFLAHAKLKKEAKAQEVKSAKFSLLSSAETQLTESGVFDDHRTRQQLIAEQSYTVEYLLNENKQLKEEIEMILKSRSKLNEIEQLVKTLSQYRKTVSDQEAQIHTLKKHQILLIKQSEKMKHELIAKDTKMDVFKNELEKVKSQPNFGNQQLKIRQMTQLPLRMDEIVNTLDKIRQYYRRSQTIQEIVNCLEKEIFWSARQSGGMGQVPQSPRHPK